jgi:glycosidase
MLRGDPAELKLAASIYMLSEGVPFIYYGEEIGLMGAKPDEQIRTPMLWNLPGRDKMQTSWVESRYNKNTIPVALQEKNKDSVLQFYKRLVRVKTAHPALYSGRMKPLFTGNSALDSWTLEAATEKAFVVLNLSDAAVTVTLPAEYTAFAGTTPMSLVFATYDGTKLSAGNTLSISPRGTAVLAGYK